MPSLEEFAELGVIRHGRSVIRDRVVGAWDDFIAVAREVDMDAASRLAGWRAHEICVHLGAWDDYQPIRGVLAAAREAQKGNVSSETPDADESNRTVTAAHRTAGREEILGALERARNDAADYLSSAEPHELDEVLVCSTVGMLPALTIIHAQIYELAVHGLDLVSCGAPQPADRLMDAGLAALADAAGALAARVGITSTAGIHSDVGSWAFSSNASGWQLGRWEGSRPRPGRPPGGAGAPDARVPTFTGKLPVRVDSTAIALLDASAARINPLMAVVTRRLKVHGLPGLLGLAPIVETVPGIPGGPALRMAAKGLAGAGGALGRLTRHLP